MSSYISQTALHPTIIEGFMWARAKQGGIFKNFLPEELHPEGLTYNYTSYDDTQALPAKEAPPGSEATFSYGKSTRIPVTAKPFRAKDLIDAWDKKWSVIDSAREKTDTLTDKILRAQDYNLIQHLTNFKQAAAGATLAFYGAGIYPYMASKDKTSAGWDDATDGAKYAIADILEAKKWIWNNSFMEADTLIGNPDIEEALLKQATIRETMYWGGQGPPVIVGGKLTKFMGLDIIIVAGKYQDETETEYALIDDRAIICHRGQNGSDLGVCHVAEPFWSNIYEEPKLRATYIEVGKTFNHHIKRQRAVVDIIDVIAPS